jgi:hypothetical protein
MMIMSKSSAIDAIRRLNPTASPDFLAGFSGDDLVEYLDRLTDAATAREKGHPAVPVELSEPTATDAATP